MDTVKIANVWMNKSDLKLLNKVPEITIFFWIIKVLCTTVGETAADFLDVSLNFGLTVTSIIVGVLLAISLIFQFKSKKYIPIIYWLSVFLISIFGTLVTDNLTDSLHVPLELSTIVFSVLLAGTFAVWYAKEKTLSIHTIFTLRREAYYWLAILFTFALGTASGDLMAESLGLGYLVSGIIVLVIILGITMAWKLKLDPVLSFWIAYIMTRPLGASIGDYLSQSPANGGLGLGPTMTTVLFVIAITVTVLYLTVSKKDQTSNVPEPVSVRTRPSVAFIQTAAVVLFLSGLGISTYFFLHVSISNAATVSVSPGNPLGDLSNFKKISEDTLSLVRAGKLPEAKTRITDLEYAWDVAEAKIRPMSPDNWTRVDKQIDNALRNLRAVHQDAGACETSLVSLINTINLLSQ